MITRLICSACGRAAPAFEPLPFRCATAAAADDVDHILVRTLDPGAASVVDWDEIFLSPEPNPFVRYRRLLHSYGVARAGGLGDAEYVDLVRELDATVADVAGTGFLTTPMRVAPGLAEAAGRAREQDLWVKDDTGNVSGSHKARHLMAVVLWLRVMEALGRLDAEQSRTRALAIASCGNAALAAAVLARADRRRLQVFVPTEADPAVLDRLAELGARVEVCTRRTEERGDPCYLRFREAVVGGALPFSVQGRENGLTLEGGLTLGYELASDLRRSGGRIDHLFLQVGGGALASSCMQGLADAQKLGVLSSLPRVHAVQTWACHPLWRAYERVARVASEQAVAPAPAKTSGRADDAETVEDPPPYTLAHASKQAAALQDLPPKVVARVLEEAARYRSRYMRAWDGAARSLASGILDDETYDWRAVVRTMVETAGFPVLVSEETLAEANQRARAATGIQVDPTGSAGWAGALELARSGLWPDRASGAVVFTGGLRSSRSEMRAKAPPE